MRLRFSGLEHIVPKPQKRRESFCSRSAEIARTHQSHADCKSSTSSRFERLSKCRATVLCAPKAWQQQRCGSSLWDQVKKLIQGPWHCAETIDVDLAHLAARSVPFAFLQGSAVLFMKTMTIKTHCQMETTRQKFKAADKKQQKGD